MRPTLALASLAVLIASTSDVHANGGVTRYCQSGASGARISASGSTSFTANGGSGDLFLHATNLPPGSTVLFALGGGPTQALPFGQGYLCIAPSFRIGQSHAGAGGTSASLSLDYLISSNPMGMITPGSTWTFQGWFRKFPSFDATDALEIDFGAPPPLEPASTISRGTWSAHPLAQFGGGIEIVSDAASWAALWAQHDPYFPQSPAPAVDFTQHSVVAVFAGLRSTGGYDLIVRRLILSVTSLDVTTLENVPGPFCIVTQALTHPFHFVLVPRVEGMTLRSWTQGVHVRTCL